MPLEVDIERQLGAFRLQAAFATMNAAVTALFGRSGAGKSSLIAAIAGLLRPDRGRIAMDGMVLFDRSARRDLAPRRRRIGLVFQDGRLFPHYSVRGNLLYGLERVVPEDRRLGFDQVVEPLGIAHLLDRRPSTLSGGEKQRVAIGRALLASPRLLLMDEPLASLDGERKAELLPLIAQLPREFGIPIVYVSHSVGEILRLADRLVLIEDGRVVVAGDLEDVTARADFAKIAAIAGDEEPFTVIATTVLDHDDALGQTRLSFVGGTLTLPRLPEATGYRVRLRIAAGDVIIALDHPPGLSVRNVVTGRVVALDDAGNLVDVTLDIGCPLRARITREARRELALEPGKPVFALIKSAAIAAGNRPAG